MLDAFALVDSNGFVKICPDLLGMGGNEEMYCVFPKKETAEKVKEALCTEYDGERDMIVLGIGMGDE